MDTQKCGRFRVPERQFPGKSVWILSQSKPPDIPDSCRNDARLRADRSRQSAIHLRQEPVPLLLSGQHRVHLQSAVSGGLIDLRDLQGVTEELYHLPDMVLTAHGRGQAGSRARCVWFWRILREMAGTFFIEDVF